ncbi:hypothetical protein [Pedobacter suwonensis]|uniref:hypothetical protein n=1 Tax=Pedobacter suwonensis TaxID=332999 RepID=UPI0011A3C161|nr:hypothetical protein [Pedobacter suwonensis]
MKSTTGDYVKFQYESIIRFYERVRAITGTQSDWEITHQSIRYTKKGSGDTISTLKQEYDILRKKFSFVISQIGEPVINGILKNHIAFIHEKFGIEATEELSAEKQRLEEQLKAINQKLNSGR